MEHNVIELKRQIEERLDAADLLLELLVHLPLVRLLLSPMIQKAVVNLLVLLLSKSLENLILLLLSLVHDVGLIVMLSSLLFDLNGLLLRKRCHGLIQDVHVDILHSVKNLRIHRCYFDLTVVVLYVNLIKWNLRQIVLACCIDRSLIVRRRGRRVEIVA